MIYRSIHKNKNGEICWRNNTQQNGTFNNDITAQRHGIMKQHIDDVT